MITSKNIKMIEVQDWDDLVTNTYKKPYSFQQQDGCKPRGIEYVTVPCKDMAKEGDEYAYESIPEEVNGDEMCVKLNTWLARDPKQLIEEDKDSGRTFGTELFWGRNFYPHTDVIAQDLYEKGLIEAGEYIINIDW